MKTRVVFRFEPIGGEVFALFPDLAEPHGRIRVYDHRQYGAANYQTCIDISRPATPDEYAPLKHELETIGYTLDVQEVEA